jgi:hypothetical protein
VDGNTGWRSRIEPLKICGCSYKTSTTHNQLLEFIKDKSIIPEMPQLDLEVVAGQERWIQRI